VATNTWNGGGSTNNWSENANWSSGLAPISTDAVSFDATSTKNCTIDVSTTIASLTLATGYGAGILTGAATGITVNINGDFTLAAANTVVFGNNSIWNITGSIDPNNVASQTLNNFAGATVNLSGTSKLFGQLFSNSVTPTRGIINVLLGATYDNNGTGGFAGVDWHNYGTVTSANELNITRSSAAIFARIYNHSTGVIGGAGVMIFCYGSQFVQQDGSVTIGLGLIAIGAGMSLVPATYAGPFKVYLQLAGLSFFWSAGTYNFTSTGAMQVVDDPGPDVLTMDNSAGAILNFSTSSFDLTSPSGGILWKAGIGGKLVFKNSAVTVKCNGQTLDTIEGFAGSTLTLGAALLTTKLNWINGTFNAAGFNVTTLGDLVVANPGQFTPAGLNAATVTVYGSLLAQGISGTLLNWQATAGWTLNVAKNPLYTANASWVNVKNCTATGGKTIQADNSTNGGSNTGWNFSPTANRPVTSVKWKVAQTQAAATKTLEARLSGSSLSVYANSVLTATVPGLTANQTVKKHGVFSYFDGSYQQCPLDVFSFPNPTLAPPIPTGVAVTTSGLVSWHSSAGALSYTVQRSVSGANTWTTIGSPTLPSFQDIPPTGGNFDYHVSASNGNGTSAYSSIVTVTYSSLLTGLVAYWPFEGTGAITTWPDSTANHEDLTLSGGTTSGVAGMVGNCAQFNSGVSYIKRVSDANLSVGGGSFTVAGWIKVSNSALKPVLGEWESGKQTFQVIQNIGTPRLDTSTTGSNTNSLSWGSSLTASTWNFYVAGYDAVAGKMFLSINGGTILQSSVVGTPFVSTSGFYVGQSGAGVFSGGFIDELGIWNGIVLTQTQINNLYNSGVGVTFPFVGVP